MQQHLTDAHKAWIRKTISGGAENLIADLEQQASAGADVEKLMATLYKTFGMSAPVPSAPSPTDEIPQEKS